MGVKLPVRCPYPPFDGLDRPRQNVRGQRLEILQDAHPEGAAEDLLRLIVVREPDVGRSQEQVKRVGLACCSKGMGTGGEDGGRGRSTTRAAGTAYDAPNHVVTISALKWWIQTMDGAIARASRMCYRRVGVRQPCAAAYDGELECCGWMQLCGGGGAAAAIHE